MNVSLIPGVLQADPGVIREHDQVFRLFCHECQRVFHDRLVDKTDKRYFYGILSEMASKHFSKVSSHSHVSAAFSSIPKSNIALGSIPRLHCMLLCVSRTKFDCL